ncbi:MAG: bifunctional (p)ppGpp synthetase/guanosine-3',5'-bis(diphosphate) 3'-pyrophosphohydrolase [Gammaproteobacteria bacterium]|nr:bifunctional (p)ppGpp synthetase/guanosine-3',5'-bis(diphosphate) 3'-pyrophosphohydrolase [Gammaproteobacteria bacterium]
MTSEILDASVICKDLLNCYSDDESRALGLETATALCTLSMGVPVIRIGFLGRLRHQSHGINDKTLELLNEEERSLLSDLEKISLIDTLHDRANQDDERLRQMLLAMANDVRVVVIKLALQLVAMRHLSLYSDEKRHNLALQTRDIQAPLANRLGIAKLKWELEDLAFRELEPQTYRLIATSLAEQRREREKFVGTVVSNLQNAIKSEGIEGVQVYGRAKHINSIFNKMKKKNKRLEEIYDLLALRVQVDSLSDCYTVLGIVHAMWKHIPSEFDDYVANPKPNGYQSLHTAVVGPEGKTIEIQIRTNEMHDYAELGVAAHWRYKEETTGKVSAFERQINWLRSLLNESDDSIAEEFAAEIKEDRVYVVTPQGKVIDLPSSSTPLDFAYHIHTDLGHRTVGARVNGNIVPITHELTTGDTVEILTQKNGKPSLDWLNPHSGALKSPRARAKVRHFFKQLERDKAIEEGKEILENEIGKQGIKAQKKYLEKAAEKYNFKSIENLYAAIGFGDIGLMTIVNYIEDIREDKHENLDDIATRLARIPIRPAPRRRSNVIIEGIDDLLISMATCCSPVPPESITGFITKTKGIRIHKSDCPNMKTMEAQNPEHIIDVDWAENHANIASAIHIQASDRGGLIREITQVLLNENITIQRANLGKDTEQNINLQLQISVRDTQHLQQAISKISKIKNVSSAMRVVSTS